MYDEKVCEYITLLDAFDHNNVCSCKAMFKNSKVKLILHFFLSFQKLKKNEKIVSFCFGCISRNKKHNCSLHFLL